VFRVIPLRQQTTKITLVIAQSIVAFTLLAIADLLLERHGALADGIQESYIRSPLELIANKNAKIRGCGRGLDEVTCKALVDRVMSGKGIEIIEPIEVIPDRAGRRFLEIGGKCPPTGADIREEPYLPFEIDLQGGQAIPFGPFKVFDISTIVSSWGGYVIIAAEGYDFEDGTMSNGINLAWKSYYVVAEYPSEPCPINNLRSLYNGGFSRPLKNLRGDALVRIDDAVYILWVEQSIEGQEHYRASMTGLIVPPHSPESIQLNRGQFVAFSLE